MLLLATITIIGCHIAPSEQGKEDLKVTSITNLKFREIKGSPNRVPVEVTKVNRGGEDLGHNLQIPIPRGYVFMKVRVVEVSSHKCRREVVFIIVPTAIIASPVIIGSGRGAHRRKEVDETCHARFTNAAIAGVIGIARYLLRCQP